MACNAELSVSRLRVEERAMTRRSAMLRPKKIATPTTRILLRMAGREFIPTE
jgi:hypothetical protein